MEIMWEIHYHNFKNAQKYISESCKLQNNLNSKTLKMKKRMSICTFLYKEKENIRKDIQVLKE